MAGHSHWHNIKHKKEKKDKKRAKKFAKLSQMIITAVRENNKETDPEMNPDLKSAIEKAKTEDMPKENIERAIKKGAGELEKGSLEKFSLEVYGPDSIGVIIQGETDNKNRTISEIKEILKKEGGTLAEPGSVEWLFDRKGVIEIENTEENQLAAIEAGAEDIDSKKEKLTVYTKPNKLDEVKKELKKYANINFAGIGFKPKAEPPKQEKYEEFLEKLRDQRDIQKVYFTTNT